MTATRHLQAIPHSATPEEAAAIIAAVERFMRETATPASPPFVTPRDEWRATALTEGVSRDPWVGGQHPWVDLPQPLP